MNHSNYRLLNIFSPFFVNFSYGILLVLLYLYGNYSVSDYTVFVILMYWFSFFLGVFFCYAVVFNGIVPKKITNLDRFNPSISLLYLFLFFNVLACVGVYGYLKSLSSSDIFDIFINLEEVRRELAIGNSNPEFIYRLLNKFNLIIPVTVFFSTLVYLTKSSVHAAFLLFFVILTAFLYSTLLLQRALFLLYFMFFSIPVLYSSYCKSSMVFFRRSVFLGVLFFILIGVIKGFRSGSKSSYGFIDYLYLYIIGGGVGLDAFLNGYDGVVNLLEVQKNYITPSGFDFNDMELGVNTFKEFRFLYPFLGIEQPSLHGEYIYSPVMTNIYTIIRPFYQDFWLYGVFLFSFLFGVTSNFVYVKLVRTGSCIYMFMYILILYALLRQFSGFSFSFIFLLVGVFVLRFFLINFRLR